MNSKIIFMLLILKVTACSSKIQYSKTENVKIYGNCDLCEKTIEKSGNVKNIAIVDWNQDTKMAKITYDSTKTNQDEILKRIALSGYDSDQFYAPDDTYSKLKSCCQYDRPKEKKLDAIVEVEDTIAVIADAGKDKIEIKKEDKNGHHTEPSKTTSPSKGDQVKSTNNKPKKENVPTANKIPEVSIPAKVEVKDEVVNQNVNQLNPVFDAYFELKDALVLTDESKAAMAGNKLYAAINKVDMTKLGTKEHIVWMKVLKQLNAASKSIGNSKDVEDQRNTFMALSTDMYDLLKSAGYADEVYYQYCPMANDNKGANWLSKEKGVKNPYFGNAMLTCGKVVEVIK